MSSKTKSPKNASLEHIPVASCHPHSANRALRDEDIVELADSIRAVGLINPIRVRKNDNGYEIVTGERRWRAHAMIGAERIAAFVHDECDDVTADTLRLVENDQRMELTALHTARELRNLKNLHGLTHEGVSQHTGIAVDRVKRYLAVFTASDKLLEAIDRHALPIKTALALTRFEKDHGEAATSPLLRKVAAGELTSRDVECLRKRRKGSEQAESPSPKRSPWENLERRIRALVEEDPEAARAPLTRLTKLLQGALKKHEALEESV